MPDSPAKETTPQVSPQIKKVAEKTNSKPEEPVPVKTTPVSPPSNTEKRASSTPSIKDALSSLGKSGTASASDADLTDSVEEHDEHTQDEIAISTEELKKYWNEFIAKLKTSQPRMHNVLKDQSLELSDEGTLQIQFRNNAQIEDFKLNIKPALLSSLRTSLQRPGLEIKELLQKSDDAPQRKHYTDQDKLKHMMEKNPVLKKLYQDFNLDFE